jgi:hypothetical protein
MESLFAAKIDELVDESNGKIRADKDPRQARRVGL